MGLFDDPDEIAEESIEDAAQAVEEEMAQLNDRVLRLAAELENTRRRRRQGKVRRRALCHCKLCPRPNYRC